MFLTNAKTVDRAGKGRAALSGAGATGSLSPAADGSVSRPAADLTYGLRPLNPLFVRAPGSLGRQSSSFLLTEDCVLSERKVSAAPTVRGAVCSPASGMSERGVSKRLSRVQGQPPVLFCGALRPALGDLLSPHGSARTPVVPLVCPAAVWRAGHRRAGCTGRRIKEQTGNNMNWEGNRVSGDLRGSARPPLRGQLTARLT